MIILQVIISLHQHIPNTSKLRSKYEKSRKKQSENQQLNLSVEILKEPAHRANYYKVLTICKMQYNRILNIKIYQIAEQPNVADI